MRRALEQKKKENKNDKKSNKRKIKKIKISKKAKIIGIFLVIVTICIILISNYTYFGLVINKNISTKDTVKVDLSSSNNETFAYNNGILIYSNGNLTFYNKNGKLNWTVEVEDTIRADINISGDYIQVINKDKNIIYIYKNKYEVSRIKVKEDILSANINSSGVTTVEYKPTGTKRAIGIYDNKGKQKYDIKINNGLVGKYVLSENARYLAYVEIDISGTSAYTMVNLIDLNKTDKGEDVHKTIFSQDNSLVYDLYFSGKKVIIRTDEKFLVYNLSSDKIDSVEITSKAYENVGSYDLKYAYIKFDENASYYLTLANMLSNKNKNIQIKEVPKYFFYKSGLAYLCYSKSIEVYNNFGMKIKEYTSDTIITRPVIFNDGKGVALLVSNKLIMFDI